MENKLLNLAADILNVKVDSITLSTSRSMLEEWDSLAHIQLIIGVESSFNIKIPIEEINDIQTIDDFLKYIGD